MKTTNEQLIEHARENVKALRERYSAKPTPKCHICGTEMTVQRMSASRITYGCTGATYDDTGCHYAAGRSIADDHYEQSRVTIVDVSDPDVLALLDELEVVNELFLRAKALMYQSGGTPIENSLNPIDAWLYDAERAAAACKGE